MMHGQQNTDRLTFSPIPEGQFRKVQRDKAVRSDSGHTSKKHSIEVFIRNPNKIDHSSHPDYSGTTFQTRSSFTYITLCRKFQLNTISHIETNMLSEAYLPLSVGLRFL